MYEQQRNNEGTEDKMAMAPDAAPLPPDADVVEQKREPNTHGECCDECKRTCKRNFWTSILNAVIKVSTIVLAAFGIQSFGTED